MKERRKVSALARVAEVLDFGVTMMLDMVFDAVYVHDKMGFKEMDWEGDQKQALSPLGVWNVLLGLR